MLLEAQGSYAALDSDGWTALTQVNTSVSPSVAGVASTRVQINHTSGTALPELAVLGQLAEKPLQPTGSPHNLIFSFAGVVAVRSTGPRHQSMLRPRVPAASFVALLT